MHGWGGELPFRFSARAGREGVRGPVEVRSRDVRGRALCAGAALAAKAEDELDRARGQVVSWGYTARWAPVAEAEGFSRYQGQIGRRRS
jgi:hypothetical protein